jgi:5-methylcytosine-specific restriction endonuclease McrA
VNGSISRLQRDRIIARDGTTCRLCGVATVIVAGMFRHQSPIDLTIDHVVPRFGGGADNDDNLQILCRSCNSKKGTRWLLVDGTWSPPAPGSFHGPNNRAALQRVARLMQRSSMEVKE